MDGRKSLPTAECLQYSGKGMMEGVNFRNLRKLDVLSYDIANTPCVNPNSIAEPYDQRDAIPDVAQDQRLPLGPWIRNSTLSYDKSCAVGIRDKERALSLSRISWNVNQRQATKPRAAHLDSTPNRNKNEFFCFGNDVNMMQWKTFQDSKQVNERSWKSLIAHTQHGHLTTASDTLPLCLVTTPTRMSFHEPHQFPKPAHTDRNTSVFLGSPQKVFPEETHKEIFNTPTKEKPLDLRTRRKRPHSPPAERVQHESLSCLKHTDGSDSLSFNKHGEDLARQRGSPGPINLSGRITNIGNGHNIGIPPPVMLSPKSVDKTESSYWSSDSEYHANSTTFNAVVGVGHLPVESSLESESDSTDILSSDNSEQRESFTFDQQKVTEHSESSSDAETQDQVVNLAQKETCSTKRVTNWSVSIFRRWMAESPRRAAVPELLKMTVPQINTYLCKFLVDARKSTGSRYPSKSLQALGQGLLRYVRNNRVYSQRECGSSGNLFKPVSQVLSMELRRTLFYEEMHGRMPKARQKHRSPLKKRRGLPTSHTTYRNDYAQNVRFKDLFLSRAPLKTTKRPTPKTENNSLDEFRADDDGITGKCQQESFEEKISDHLSQNPCDASQSKSPVPNVDEELTTLSVFAEKGPDPSNSVRCKSTQRNTRWAVHLFNNWRQAQQNSGKPPIPDILQMDAKEANSYLAEYITNVMKTDGTPYIPSCLYSLACGLLRHVRSKGRRDLDFMNSKDSRFAEFQNAMTTRINPQGCRDPKDRSKSPQLKLLSQDQETKLWQYHVFGMETAKSLQYSVFYYNLKLFGIKSFLSHRNLNRLQFSVKRNDSENYIRYDSGVDDKPGSGSGESCQKYHEKKGAAPGSIVELYDVYLTAIGDSGPFYKRLLGLQGSTARFSEQNIGIRSFQAIWADIWEAASMG